MCSDKAENLTQLVILLESDTEVGWDEVAVYVSGFRGFERLLEVIFDPPARISTSAPFYQQESNTVSDGMRTKLLDMVKPYAILLNSQLAPIERAAAMERDAGVKPVPFCKQCLHDGLPEVVSAAQAVLEACQHRGTLLRGTIETPANPATLLRSVSETSDNASGEPPTKQSWLSRLRKRS